MQTNNPSAPSSRIVYLIGMPGCGKSTLGRAAAALSDFRFVDLDAEVERCAGMSVAQVFEHLGEPAFRRLETDCLRAVAASPDLLLVATGGGTPCSPANVATMLSSGLVVALDAPDSVIVDRLVIYGATRPAVAGRSRSEIEQYVAATHAARAPHYACAQCTFDSSRLESPRQIAESARLFADTFLTPHIT